MWFKRKDSRPTAQEAARRLLVLKYVTLCGIVTPPPEFIQTEYKQWDVGERRKFEEQQDQRHKHLWGILEDAGLWPHLSPREIELAKTSFLSLEPQQRTNARWRMEAVQPIMWALNLVPQLPPYDTLANTDLLKAIPAKDMSSFIKSARLREQIEVDNCRETAELWHWRSRTRQCIEMGVVPPADEKAKAAGFHTFDDIVRFTARKSFETGTIPRCIEDDFPVYGKAYRDLTQQEWALVGSITVERHFALNWLCGSAPDNKWDETPTDT